MINNIFDLFLVGEKGLIIGSLIAFGLCFILLRFPPSFFPVDKGRAFAINGALSKGKVRGVGLTFVCVFICVSLVFLPINREYVVYCILLFAMMLSGYLDDASEIPWKDYKKGLIDLVIAVVTMINFVNHNSTQIFLGNMQLSIPTAIYFALGVILLWVSINVTNCSDGVDGLCSSLCCIVLVGYSLLYSEELQFYGSANYFFVAVLLAYLYFNSKPSSILMGDAGSRALGFFIGVISIKSGHPFSYILMTLIILLDGGLGLMKIFMKRFLHISILSNIITPLHDHVRKKYKWSDSQVVFRFSIFQFLIIALLYVLVESWNY